MAGSFISKRVIFPKGGQKTFIFNVKKKLGLTYIDLARLLKISYKTLADWRREKFSMPLEAVKILLGKTDIKLSKGIKIREPFWYVKKGARVGGTAVYKKYGRVGGDPEYRKKKWREWWEREGKYEKNPIIGITKPIKKPQFSKELAEFVGIILGDGGIAKYQVVITLHAKDDKEYGKFVISLIKKLFRIPVSISYDKRCRAVDLTVSRRELVRFCIEKLGLKGGNKVKQQVDIPNWIKENKQYAIACVRGLVDTDGSVFIHHYRVNGKLYEYKKLSFTNHSWPLLQSVFNILKDNGLKPRLTQDRDVRLDSIEDMLQYFKMFNSSNPKNLKKYYK